MFRDALRGRRIDDLLRTLAAGQTPTAGARPAAPPLDGDRDGREAAARRRAAGGAARLTAALSARGVQVVRAGSAAPEDPALSRLSAAIVSQFAALGPVCRHIRRHAAGAREFSIPLDRGGASVARFCAEAHRVGLLRGWRRHVHPRPHLAVRPNPAPPALAFFAGGWLERYVRSAAGRALARADASAESLWNLVVRLPGGEDFELDYVTLVDRRLLWIESKTGEYQSALDKYRRVARLLGLAADSAWLAISDRRLGAEAVRAIEGLYGLSVVTPAAVERRVAVWVLGTRRRMVHAQGPNGNRAGGRKRGGITGFL